MVELADTLDLTDDKYLSHRGSTYISHQKSSGGDFVWVRVPLVAPLK